MGKFSLEGGFSVSRRLSRYSFEEIYDSKPRNILRDIPCKPFVSLSFLVRPSLFRFSYERTNDRGKRMFANTDPK